MNTRLFALLRRLPAAEHDLGVSHLCGLIRRDLLAGDATAHVDERALVLPDHSSVSCKLMTSPYRK